MEDKKLKQIISGNKHTAYGERHAFCEIKSIADYQRKAPLTTYEDYLPYIRRIKNGEQNILTKEPVLLLEPSSGSVSAKKLIPYTKGLKREFSSAIARWLLDLNRHFPRLKYGQAYFSITPQAPITEGAVGLSNDKIMGSSNKANAGAGSKVNVGFHDDDEYIGGPLGRFIASKLCVPPGRVKAIEDMEEFWNTTIGYIKHAKNLRLVSVWNPTLLLLMLEKAGMPAKELFPDLEVISCWADGNSAPYAAKLQKAFPGAYIQPKGLLATEGVMTIPLEGVGKRLTNSHFFEFIGKDGDVRLKNQLDAGEEYEIVLTTSGGLYRYNIGDIVRYNGNMCFDFVGKSANISDYFGEKLNEAHVRRAIASAGAGAGEGAGAGAGAGARAGAGEGAGTCEGGFRLLAPCGDRYVLYTETYADADAIDGALRENFHYDYCRRLGQLRKAEVAVVKDGDRQYMENCVRFGMRLGDVKPTCLSNRQGWVFK